MTRAPLPVNTLAEYVPSLNARVTDLRFFESSTEGAPFADRVYTNWFPRSTARYINWELSLAYPYLAQNTSAVIKTVYYRADGTIYAEFEKAVPLQQDWTQSTHSLGLGQGSPGQWPPGSYRVVLSAAVEQLASGWFEVADDSAFSLGSTSTSSLPEGVQQVGQLLPWISDSNSHSEIRAISAMSQIAVQDPALAAQVAAFGWVLDGIDPGESGFLEYLSLLSSRDPFLAAEAARLSWILDGIDGHEWSAFRQLVLMSGHAAALTLEILGLPWVRDEISEPEQQSLESIAILAREDAGLAANVAGLPWFTDSISEDERWSLWSMAELIAHSYELGNRVANFPWLADSITEDERWTLGNLRELAVRSLQLGTETAGFPWVADGITDTERWTLRSLRVLTQTSLKLGSTAAGLPWLADSITEDERWALSYLSDLAEKDKSLATQLADGQFLSASFDERDGHALLSILQLSDSPEDLELLRSAEWFVDGIDHEDAALLTVLYRQSLVSPVEFRSLLKDHEYQSKTASLPLAGDVQLTILRLSPEVALKAQGQIDRLENAARHIEEFFGVPFPQRDIILLYGETGTQTTGVHAGTHMVVDRPVSIQGDLRRIEAHEVGHYYWGSSAVPLWFREGGSDFLASYVIEQVYGESLRSRFNEVGGREARYCESLGMGTVQRLLDNLAAIGYAEQSGLPYFVCNYILGEALFLELYDTIDTTAFRELWKEIYLTGESEGRRFTEEEIYQMYLNATPVGQDSTFKQLYSTWHGGSFPER